MTTQSIPAKPNPPKKDWDDHLEDVLLNGVPAAVRGGWSLTKGLASPLYTFGNWAWEKAGGPGSRVENYWTSCSDKTKTLAKRIGYGTAFVVAGGAAAAAVYPAIASLSGDSAAAVAEAMIPDPIVATAAVTNTLSSVASAGVALGSRFLTNGFSSAAIATGTALYNLKNGDSKKAAIGKGALAFAASTSLISSNPLTKAAVAGGARVVYELAKNKDALKSAGVKAAAVGVATTAAAYCVGPILTGAAVGVTETGRRLYRGEPRAQALKMGLAAGATSTTIAAIAGPATLGLTAAGTTAVHSLAQDGTLADVAGKGLTTAAVVGVSAAAIGAIGTYVASALVTPAAATALTAPVAVATAAAATAATTTVTAGSILYGAAATMTAGTIAAAGATTLGVGAGLGTALHSWVGKGEPLMTALAKGGAAAAAVTAGTLALVSPAGIGAAVAATLVGGIAAGTAAQLLNPGESSYIHFPEQGGELFQTVGSISLPKDPTEPLKQLAGKASKLKSKQPSGTQWQDPQLTLIKGLKSSVLADIRAKMIALGPNPPDKLKVEAVAAALKTARIVVDPSLINISLVEKIEEVRADAPKYVEAKKYTDKQLDLLVKNSSIYLTIMGMHVYMGGCVNTNEVNEAMKAITRTATAILAEGKKLNLWDLYKTHLGKQYDTLGLSQKFLIWVTYIFGYKWNLIPKMLQGFVKNSITEFRNILEPKNEEKLHEYFETSFDQMGKFLDIHNGSAEQYAQGPAITQNQLTPRESLEDAVDQMGDMDALCQNFSNILIDRALPFIPMAGKNYAILTGTAVASSILAIALAPLTILYGLYSLITSKYSPGITAALLFPPFSLIYGIYRVCTFKKDLINEVKINLPFGIKNLIDSGISQTLPTQYAFKIAVADSLTMQIEFLIEDMKVSSTSKPPRLKESSFASGTADKLLRALRIRQLGKNPTKQQVAELLKKMDTEGLSKTERLLRQLIIKGSSIFMFYFSKTPEKMEKLFGDMLNLSNITFEEGAEIKTEQNFEDAYTRLKNATGELITDAIAEGVEAEVKGPASEKRLKDYILGRKDETGKIVEKGLYDIQRDRGIRTFETLHDLCKTMSTKLEGKNPAHGIELLQHLDHYGESLRRFVSQTESMDIKLYAKPVQTAFYQTFYPIYEEASHLTEHAINMQGPKIQYDKTMNLAAKYRKLLEQIGQEPDHLKKQFDAIEALGNAHGQSMPDVAETLKVLRGLVANIELTNKQIKKETQILNGLSALGRTGAIPPAYVLNPEKNDTEIQRWIQSLRNTIPLQDQPELFDLIQTLRAVALMKPQPDLNPLLAQIADEIQFIGQKHMIRKQEKIEAQKQSTLLLGTEIQSALQKTIKERDTCFREIKQELQTLTLNTKTLLEKFEEVEPKTFAIPVGDLPDNPMTELQTLIGKPIEKKLDPYLDLAFDLMTEHQVYRGVSRLAMKEIIKENKKNPSPALGA